jgi:hypothetical protein
MRILLSLLALTVVSAGPPCARAADQDFNGRWDIAIDQPYAQIHSTTTKAWWLEISGAGTDTITMKFVGSPDGSLDDITGAKIEDGVLHFTWMSRPRQPRARAGQPGGQPGAQAGGQPAAQPPRPQHQERNDYVVKLVNGKMEGTMTGLENLTFKGSRAPVIDEHDDGTWVKGEPIVLFNGKDLTGWTGVDTPEAKGWGVENGVLKGLGQADDLITVAKYWNYELHIEYKLGARSNSGIGLRGRYEVQIAADYGQPAGMHGTGALYTRVMPRVNASKPPDEWQTYEIRLVGREVTTVLNGEKLYERGVIDGLTGIAFNAFEGEPGPLELQGDHGAVEFRNIILTPLIKKK